MKPLFKYFLLLILFCSYGAASLELNERESKENYGKETHEYTLSQKQSEHSSSIDFKKLGDVKDFYAIIAFAHYLFSQPSQDRNNLATKFHSPQRLNKIYLFNSVFLI